MSFFTEEEMRFLGQKYLEEHPELEARVREERAKAEAENPTPPVEAPVDPVEVPVEAPAPVEPEGLISIVYPVSWPAPTEDVPRPHSTIMFLGSVADATFTKDDLKQVLKTFIWEPFDVAIGEVKMFGPNEDVPVVTLLGQTLYTNRQTLEDELASRGIKDVSEFSYNPHITVDPQSMAAMPFHSVRLGTPQIWFGDDRG